jgi:hypothetical protein
VLLVLVLALLVLPAPLYASHSRSAHGYISSRLRCRPTPIPCTNTWIQTPRRFDPKPILYIFFFLEKRCTAQEEKKKKRK